MNNCSFSKSFPQSIINQPKFSKDSEPIFFFFFFESHIENLTKPKQQKLQNLKTSLLYFQIWVWIDIYIYIYIVRSQFVAQTQKNWVTSPMSQIQ